MRIRYPKSRKKHGLTLLVYVHSAASVALETSTFVIKKMIPLYVGFYENVVAFELDWNK